MNEQDYLEEQKLILKEFKSLAKKELALEISNALRELIDATYVSALTYDLSMKQIEVMRQAYRTAISTVSNILKKQLAEDEGGISHDD